MSLKHICMNNRVDIWTCTLHPCTSMNHSLRYAPSISNCTIRVSITTHVIWYWHTGHAIMFSRHSVSQNHYIRSAYAGHVWEHVSFDIIGGTFVDGVWLCMTHPHAWHLLTHVGFYIMRLSLPDCLVSSFLVLCSLTSSPHIISSGRARWNKGGIPQGYKAGWSGGMQGHTRTCFCAHTRTHTCTQAHTCTHTCGHTSTACVCICSSRFLEPLSPPSLCDLTDL